MKILPRRSSSLRVAAHLLPALCAAVAGCGPTTPEVPPQPIAPPAPVKPGPRPALSLPARALPNQRAVTFVARIGGKALYTVGGERWLIDAQGKVEREREPLGDKLESVMALSIGSTTAVGWNSGRVLAFGDLLGTPRLLAESEGTLTHVRPGPASVLLFTYSNAVALDPSTGAEKTGMFPTFPVKDAIFADDKRGVAFTAIGGVGTTTDGGQTWKPLRHKVTATVPTTLFADGGELYLRDSYGSRVARVDVATSSLGDVQDLPSPRPPTQTPIEVWLTASGNPILSAVRNGIDLGKDGGVVAASGTVARVDLGSGAFTETAKYSGTSGECRGATSGKNAYLVCGTTGKRGVGSRLWRVKTDGKLELEEMKDVTFGGSSVPELVGAPGGGLMVMQGCVDKWGGLCVRQPDGSFVQMETSMVAYQTTMGALADGRIVSVGVRKGADIKAPARPAAGGAKEAASDAGPLLEMVVSTARERKVLEEVVLDGEVSVLVTRPEEGADGEVRFLVSESRKGKTEVFLYSYEPGTKGFEKTLIPDAVQASFADGVLVARGKGDSPYRVSHDHGMTFRDLEMPKGASPTFSTVNRLGIVSSSHVRVGWEPLPEPALAPKLTPGFRLKSPPTATRPSTDLACKSSGAGKTGSILPRYDAEIAGVFDIKAAPKGTRRSSSQTVGSPLDVVMHLAAEGKDVAPTAPPGTKAIADRWVVRWQDGRDIDAKPKSVSGKAPYPDFYTYIRGAWGRDGRLFASLSAGGKNVLFRTKGAAFETAEVAASLIPYQGAPQAFSSDGNLIAYLAGEILVVWKSGEAPRPVAMVNQRYSVLLGAPSKEGVPVLAVSDPQSYYRVFALPATKQDEPLEQQWISASWDGWTRVPSVFSKGVVPFCDAKPSGALFRGTLNAPSISTRFGVDGASVKSTRSQRYDVVSDGQSLCFESLAAELWERASISVKSGASIKQVGLDVIRIANKGKKADITLAGKPIDKVPLHALTCELTTPP